MFYATRDLLPHFFQRFHLKKKCGSNGNARNHADSFFNFYFYFSVCKNITNYNEKYFPKNKFHNLIISYISKKAMQKSYPQHGKLKNQNEKRKITN